MPALNTAAQCRRLQGVILWLAVCSHGPSAQLAALSPHADVPMPVCRANTPSLLLKKRLGLEEQGCLIIPILISLHSDDCEEEVMAAA